MTTIVASLTGMAADTRVTWDDDSTSPGIKIFVCGEELIGTAGDVAAGSRFLEWYKSGGKKRKPKLTKDFKAIKLGKDGIFLIDHDSEWVKIDDTFYAIGSGAPYALGALSMGASVKEAVEIAAKYDNWTGGIITVLELS